MTLLSLLRSGNIRNRIIKLLTHEPKPEGPCACRGKYPDAVHKETYCARRVA